MPNDGANQHQTHQRDQPYETAWRESLRNQDHSQAEKFPARETTVDVRNKMRTRLAHNNLLMNAASFKPFTRRSFFVRLSCSRSGNETCIEVCNSTSDNSMFSKNRFKIVISVMRASRCVTNFAPHFWYDDARCCKPHSISLDTSSGHPFFKATPRPVTGQEATPKAIPRTQKQAPAMIKRYLVDVSCKGSSAPETIYHFYSCSCHSLSCC